MTSYTPREADGRAGGLTSIAAARLLQESGPNEVLHEDPESGLSTFVGQFRSPIIWLLLAACAVSAFLGEVADASAIGAILLVNALVGFSQEYRAERALFALRSLAAPRARVLRDGRVSMVAAKDVVPGDTLLLEAGDVVAADAEVQVAHNLSTSEASLTGESLPVEKVAQPSATEAPLADRRNAVFMGTAVATGTGRAVVRATGMRTEFGKIASLLATPKEKGTPLQARLEVVTRWLICICLGLVGIVAVMGFVHRERPFDVFLTSVALAVAAVPEGLPALVTIALALGVRRIAARNVLVRKLPAVETLGCATVICTDKTGTLTQGAMVVRELWSPDDARLLDAATACVDAELGVDGKATGDPTEIAILVKAKQVGIARETIERERPRVSETPFDPALKRMSILRADNVLYVKGAFEVLRGLSTTVPVGATEANARMAESGLRVLAVAEGEGERNLRMVGLIGIADPPRADVVRAVRQALEAGVEVVMITGDHPITAEAIAREIGILRPDRSASEVVHARATPEDKLRIVRTWKERGAVVAMTGDGVNDAPALREAHIGIAMGAGGAEVAREVSDVVLTDDNFASIIAAVREGRGIFDNIRKTLVYLLSGNLGELLGMEIASLAGLPMPLLPLRLLWINLVTETLPALALVTEKTDEDVLRHPPRGVREPMLGRHEWTQIGATAALQASILLGVFVWARRGHDLVDARSLAFTALVLGDLFRAFAARSGTRLFPEVGVFTNLRLLAVVVMSALAQFSLLYIPATQRLFGLRAPPLKLGVVCLAAGLIPVTVLELRKVLHRLCVRASDLA